MGDPELEKFKTEIDFRAFAAREGYQLDPKDSWAGSAVMRHADNDKIIIKRDADGHWVFFSVRSDASGTILDFVKYRLGLSLGAARKELRAFMGQPPSVLTPYPPLPRIAKDRIKVERTYARMVVALRHPYLETERGIPAQLLGSRRFAGCIRTDSQHGNAIFPHYDAEGLCGFEIKNRGYTGYATGGSKGLFMSNVETGDDRIVFFESGIDALSYAVLFPDERTRYASLGGKPSPMQRELIRSAAAVMPQSSRVIGAMDSDAAGAEIAEMVREAVKLTGRSDLRFEVKEPQGYHDWNDQLRKRPKPSVPHRRGKEPSVA